MWFWAYFEGDGHRNIKIIGRTDVLTISQNQGKLIEDMKNE
jgi:hypothetical protein